jgi:glycosyltransferase involved in cell wall biosynthesis
MTPPLRILVATPLPRTVTGGIEEYAYAVVDALRARGNDVTVLTTRYGDGPGPQGGPSDVTVLEAKEVLGRPVCYRPRSYLQLLSLVRRSELVHIHMPFPFVEMVVANLARVMGRPVLVTYHMDAVVDRAGRGRSNFLHHLAERLYRTVSAIPTVNLADRVCTNTNAYALQSPVLRRRLDHLVVVHQGIDPEKFRMLSLGRAAEVRRDLLGDRYTQLVCFVGRLVPYKGLNVLLDAIEALHRGRTLFVIGGRGPEEPRLRRAIEDRRLTNVRLLGYVPDQDLMNLFCAADLVVSPSISSLESTPITLLYAKAAGIPVVGTDVGGTAECIPNDGVAGLVVPAGDSTALGEAIGHLLAAGPARSPEISPRFWLDVAEEYATVMGQLCHGRREGPTAWAEIHPTPYTPPSNTTGGK